MREELYARIHPDIKSRMPDFAEALSPVLFTRDNLAYYRAKDLAHAKQLLIDEKKNGNPLFSDVTMQERMIPGLNPGDPDVRVIISKPVSARGPLPGCIGIHGGGTIMGSADEEQLYFMRFARQVNCVVVAPDYRVAPEDPYPAAVNDCYAALLWLNNNAEELGVDTERLGAYGTSCGGLLTAAISLKARDEGKVRLAAVYLGSPMLDYRNVTPSSKEMDATEFLWSGPQNVLAWEMYLNGIEPVPAYASPAMAEDLSGLPPTIILCGELDPLRDETIDYALRLYRAGVPTDFHIFPGLFHGGDIVGAGTPLISRIGVMMMNGMRNLLHKGYF